MTHSHALDFALCEAIFARHDFAWFGLIGSATKRSNFARQFVIRGLDPDRLADLSCPIGIPGIQGKHPAVIALAVAAQLQQVREARAAIEHAAHPPPRRRRCRRCRAHDHPHHTASSAASCCTSWPTRAPPTTPPRGSSSTTAGCGSPTATSAPPALGQRVRRRPVREAATLHDYRGHWCCPASSTATCTTPRPA
jgi:hypothetical protein